MLSRSEQELEAAIPSATQSASDNSHSPSAAQLRILMGQVCVHFMRRYMKMIVLILMECHVFIVEVGGRN